jgi:hypothetical protein
MNSGHQLLVIWEKGRSHEDAILRMIAADPALEVVGMIDVTWPQEHFGAALGQLYGERLPSRSEKQRHCGTGPFLVVIVRDLDPRPGVRRTPRGLEHVDTHMFDLKQEARRLTGGGHRVHATDSAEEFRRDLIVLAQMTEEQLIERGSWTRHPLIGPPAGVDGWTDVDTMLAALGRRTDYCVLRNFESWGPGGPVDDHPDIDLLIASVTTAGCAVGASLTSKRRGRVQHEVRIAGRRVELDLRSPGDGYLPEALASRTLADARAGDRGFMVPSRADHFETLAYHALVHRRELTDDYRRRLECLAPPGADVSRWLGSADGRRTLLRRISADTPLPSDPTVGFNDLLVGPAPGLARRRARQRVRSAAGGGLRRLGLVP